MSVLLYILYFRLNLRRYVRERFALRYNFLPNISLFR